MDIFSDRHMGPSFNAFLEAHTRIEAPVMCPEIPLHLADDIDAIWERQESCLAAYSAAPPYWSVAWVGGQALARYTLDNPAHFRDRSVLDFGSGSGLCAIAAAKAGATADASDIDPYSIAAIAANSRLNNTEVEPLRADLIGVASRWDIVVAGDLWYDGPLARRLNAWLVEIAREGTEVLIGDCGRAHFPRRGISLLQRYEIRASESLEQDSTLSTAVWRLGYD
jgi:predicted nicotinamide N-methyase